VPLMQEQSEEYRRNLAPPRPQRREQESSRGQMVHVEQVNEFLEQIIQQQEQQEQQRRDEVGDKRWVTS